MHAKTILLATLLAMGAFLVIAPAAEASVPIGCLIIEGEIKGHTVTTPVADIETKTIPVCV